MTNYAIEVSMDTDAVSNIAAFAMASGSQLTYMRYSKGEFTAGADGEVIDEDVEFVPDMSTLSRGYVIWKKGAAVAEVMAPVASGKRVSESDLPDHGPYEENDGPREQTSIEFRRVPDGARYMFKTSSRGGTQALQKLGAEFANRMKISREPSFPIVNMVSSSYKHERYGKIFVPVFQVVGWTATAANDGAIEAEIVEAPTKGKKRDSVLG
jgi:hypothetical protein